MGEAREKKTNGCGQAGVFYDVSQQPTEEAEWR